MTSTIVGGVTAAGYRATVADDGVMTVHHVPIFVECEREGREGLVIFGTEWIAEAVLKAKQAETEGYLPPLHIRHHEASTEANDSVQAAGFIRIIGIEKITFKGSPKDAIFADLIVTDPAVQLEIMQSRLPYRSVEIANVDTPSIHSLALLDHEAPFLELPMLMVSNVEGGDTGAPNLVANATFRTPWSIEAGSESDSVAAYFRRGNRAHLLFREASMADEPKKTDDDDKKDKGENMEAEAMDTKAIVKAIADGSISVADMEAIVAAIETRRSESEVPVEEEAPAPAAAPGAEAMSKDNDESEPITDEAAALAGENAGLKARVAEIEAKDVRRDEVAVALKMLADRPLGADLEKQLTTFHKDHGPKAFSAYVDAMDKATPPADDADDKGDAFNSQVGKVPEVALAYQKEGTDAVDTAARFCAEWETLSNGGHTRMSQERYVGVNMAKVTQHN